MNNNIYIKMENENQLTVVVYVVENIFGGSINTMCQKFAKEMQKEFYFFMLSEISFFLDLQIS